MTTCVWNSCSSYYLRMSVMKVYQFVFVLLSDHCLSFYFDMHATFLLSYAFAFVYKQFIL